MLRRRSRAASARTTLLAATLLALSLPAFAAESFLCRGDDPAWEISGSGGSAVLGLDHGKGRSLTGAVTSLAAEGVLVWRGRASDEPGDLVATIIKGACIDDKDGRTGSHAAIVSLPGPRVLIGCCSMGARAGEAAKPSADAAGTASDAAGPAAGMRVRVRGAAGERINVREEPGAKGSRVAARLSGGTEVTVAEARRVDGQVWYRITADGLDGPGWIRGDLLAAAEDAVAAPAPASAGKASSADEALEDWSRRAVELMPAIRACFDATPTKPVSITKAWPMNHGMAGVRLANGRGQRLECIAPVAGGKPASYRTLAKDARPLPGEGQPVLALGMQPRPAGKCRREELLTLPGETRSIGTLSYRAC